MASVLVVEDEFGIADLFQSILMDAGYAVRTAINGQHGLEKLAEDVADLVFLDFMMPVLDGPAMLRAMGADPALRDIPVVMMSSMPESSVAARCSGYVTFLRKPFRLPQVLNLAARLAGPRLMGGI